MGFFSKATIVILVIWWLAPGVILNCIPPQYQPIVISSLDGTKKALSSIWSTGTKMIVQANPQLTQQPQIAQ